MKAAIIIFPGSNREHDAELALKRAGAASVTLVWHGEENLPNDVDLIVLPGGFSYGDYLRSGAIAANSPIMHTIKNRAAAGVAILGICNGFQILCEAGLLPGALLRNRGGKFICRQVSLRVTSTQSIFTRLGTIGQTLRAPIAHHDGNYYASPEVLAQLHDQDRIAFSYHDADNPNGSCANIAGILSENRRILGLMPHLENATDPIMSGGDGSVLFASLMAA
ncbi:MAG: phosphoribosylformylglycinamidine synthase subunit PurQ [Alphaproteobacteria bacterium]|nr:phosphoribosylformylglycinamidine synthase subunit PurQ [Alphaproteobacteria bacterium]